MKMRIFGGLFVLAILVALFLMMEDQTSIKSNPAAQSQPVPSSNDADLKGLKIP